MNKSAESTLCENDIRPDHLMKKAMELLEEDTYRLMAQKDKFVRGPCPACGSTKSHIVMQKRRMEFEICEDCETVFGNPRPPAFILEQYYKEAKYYVYWNENIYPQSEAARREGIFRPRALRLKNICEQYSIPTHRMVEVGAGFGIFCEEVRSLGLFDEIIAIEPTPALAESCRKRGLHVIEKPVEQVELDRETVNVIASFEVIEHILHPVEYLKSCYRLLSPDGLLVLSCPNIKGFDLIVLREVADTITPEHLNYFHPGSMRILLERCGFNILEITTPGELDADIVRKKVIAGQFNLESIPFLNLIFLNEWDRLGTSFQNFLADNGLSSHMWAVASRR